MNVKEVLVVLDYYYCDHPSSGCTFTQTAKLVLAFLSFSLKCISLRKVRLIIVCLAHLSFISDGRIIGLCVRKR